MKKRKLDSRWFIEDLVAGDPVATKEAKESTETALRNSTIIARRLKRILEEEVEKTYLAEEDYTAPQWERIVLGSASRRKTLQEIIKLLP